MNIWGVRCVSGAPGTWKCRTGPGRVDHGTNQMHKSGLQQRRLATSMNADELEREKVSPS